MSGSLFLAVEPSEETRSLLAQMLARAYGDEWPLPGRLSPPENWHVTVRFLGPVEGIDAVRLDRLMAGLDQAPSEHDNWPGRFTVALSGMGAFPRPEKATVLWVGVESEPLVTLAQLVEDMVGAVGFEPEERPYRPHLTLSRLRPPMDVTDLTALDWGRLRFDANQLTLFRSLHQAGGVRYEPIERFTL